MSPFALTWVDLVILILATSEVVEVWRHGSLFAGRRAVVQELTPFHWWARLLDCPFCLSFWVALLLTLLSAVPGHAGEWIHVGVILLAVARGANLVNDLTYEYCRTPKAGASYGTQPTSDTGLDAPASHL